MPLRLPLRWRSLACWVAVVVVAALPFVPLPLPRAWDPRREEVPADRYAELGRFAGERTRKEVEGALALVDPEGRLRPYYTLEDDSLLVRRWAGSAPVRVALRRTAAAPASPSLTPTPTPPWRRVALDPGHFGGAWSRTEKRHHSKRGQPVVREGDLAWATARLLERDLRAAGAEVLLLRGPPPEAPYPTGADPGFDPAAEASYRLDERHPVDGRWLPPFRAVGLWRQRARLQVENPFDLYVRRELRRRAAAAGAFAADVTLSIHWDYTESDANGVLVFMPGNFVGPDLASASQRFWAFRRALDGTLDPTLRLASAMGAALRRHFDLPALTPAHDRETGVFWRPIDPERGIHARNLAVLRRTPGLVLVLEGPCVNQSQEYPRLLGTEVEVDGRRYPQRVRQYADAVLDALYGTALTPTDR